jgi:hypothetical protein
VDEPLTITHMVVENFLGVHFIELDLDRGLTPIEGRNAQGKSSFIAAIKAAFGGRRECPGRPIRDGARRARVVAELPGYKVTRYWSSNDHSGLEVHDAEGSRLAKPQEILDRLVGDLTFDPIRFLELSPAEQAETLRRLAGLDFAALDADREEAYRERAEVNKAIKRLEGQVVGVPWYSAPREEVSVAGLGRELTAANDRLAENRRLRERFTQNKVSLASHEKTNTGLRDRIAELRRELAEGEARAEELHAVLAEQEIAVAALADPDVGAIQRRMEEAEGLNRRVRAAAERRTLEEELRAAREHADDLTTRIQLIDGEKVALVAAATFPVEGLSLDESGEGATYRGRPIAQASTAEGIRIGLEIGAALNPRLRTILVHRGESLDPDSLRLVAEWARGRDYQVILERVTDGTPSRDGVTLEDGRVKG